MRTFPFYNFWFAKTSIALADVIYIMVIVTFIYQRTNSALIASLIPLLKAVATIIAGLTSPFLYKNYSFKRLLISLQLVKAVLLSALLLGFSFITSHTFLLLFVVLIISLTEGWGTPLLTSVTPKIVEELRLVKANSLLSISSQSVQIAGYSFTGVAVLKWGHFQILLVSVALVWLSVYCLRSSSRAIKNVSQRYEENQSKFAVMKEGWSHIWTNHTLRTVTLMDVIEGMAGSIWIGAITLVYVTDILHRGEEWWGYIKLKLLYRSYFRWYTYFIFS